MKFDEGCTCGARLIVEGGRRSVERQVETWRRTHPCPKRTDEPPSKGDATSYPVGFVRDYDD